MKEVKSKQEEQTMKSNIKQIKQLFSNDWRQQLSDSEIENQIKMLSQEQIEYMYCNQYNETLDLPSIDQQKIEGDWVYHIFIYEDVVSRI